MTEADLPSGRTVSKRASEIRHGTPGGYRKGCRCRKCTLAKSAQRAEERARKRAREAATVEHETPAPESETAPAANGTESPAGGTTPAEGETGPGQVERAVIDELELHEGSAGVPPLAAVARALAQEIDAAAGTSVAGAARQLVATLSEIRKLSAKTDDELAQLLAAMGRG